MKNIGKFAVLGAVLAASASFAFADTVQLTSYSTAGAITPTLGDGINGVTLYGGVNLETFTYPNTVAQPNQTPTGTVGTGTTSFDFGTTPGTWSDALTTPIKSDWVGAYATAEPGGTNVPQGNYTFSTNFNAIGGVYNGTLSVMSDDTEETILNYGTANQIILNSFAAIGSDNKCADTPSNCTSPAVDVLTNVNLFAGKNTLTFIVEQAGNETVGDPSGLDFDGSLTQASAPEPNSLILLGTGLFGAAGAFFRKRVTA